MSKNTYVISINGKTGTPAYEMEAFLPDGRSEGYYEVHAGPSTPPMRVIFLDAKDIPVSGTSGRSIYDEIVRIAQAVTPLSLTRASVKNDEYTMHLQEGISL